MNMNLFSLLQDEAAPSFWEKIAAMLRNYFLRLYGIDLMLKASENGTPIPAQAYLILINQCIVTLLGLFMAYRVLYFFLGLFGKSRTYPSMPKDKRYAIVCSARNEEKVIANLCQSVHAMSYPQELIDLYIIADNCTDKTAEIARNNGATVVERFDDVPSHKRKGWALHYFYEKLKAEGKIKDYYAFVHLDADNVFAPDFLDKMNDCLQSGNFDAAIGYRNVKNMDESWFSAMCGMNVYTVTFNSLRARSVLKTGQELYGPSMTFRSDVLADGWDWTTIAEDSEAYAVLTAEGKRIGYCEEARVYEEEPTKLKTLIRQQARWGKGGLILYPKVGPKLILSFFKHPTWAKYDLHWQVFPSGFVTFVLGILYNVLSLIFFLVFGNQGYDWRSFWTWPLSLIASTYFSMLFQDFIVILREWKRFHLSKGETARYIWTFPFWQMSYSLVTFVALFTHVTWKKIDHHTEADAAKLAGAEANRIQELAEKKAARKAQKESRK